MRKKLLSSILFALAFAFLMPAFGQKINEEALKAQEGMNASLRKNAAATGFHPEAVNLKKDGLLSSKSAIKVLVASPDAANFTEVALPAMQALGDNVTYTATNNLGELTVETMRTYDIVWTFNIRKWDFETGTTATEWSNKLAAYLDAGGMLIECQFVNGYDAWGLLNGDYITGNKSPFIKSTKDITGGNAAALGTVANANHPIMSGVTTVSTNYFVQDVNVRDDAELICSWNVENAPMVAVYPKVVAFNGTPVGSVSSAYVISFLGDGYKMFYNAIVWLAGNLAPQGAPGEVTDFTVTPDAAGGNTAALAWKNPTVTAQGEALTSITKIEVFLDDAETPIHTINTAQVGANVTWTATNLTSGTHKFIVVCSNANGKGISKAVNAWIGFDVPAAATALTLVSEGEGGKLTWTAPTIGLHGGALNTSPITYKIVRLPDEVVLATAHTTTSFQDNQVPVLNVYKYKVTSTNGTGEGGVATSNAVMLGASVTVPYTMGFEESEAWNTWTIVNANGDAQTWKRAAIGGNTAPACMQYDYNSAAAADDWLISPNISLEAGKSYKVKIWSKLRSATYPEKFRIMLGQGASPESFTTELLVVNNLTVDYAPFEAIFTATTSGNYNLAIHANSDANMWSMYVDDFSLSEVQGTDLAAISVKGPLTPMVGKEFKYNVTVKNEGSAEASGYTVNLIDANNNILATNADCPTLAVNTSVAIGLTFSPTTAGPAVLRGQVVLEGDGAEANNLTPEYNINVFPASGQFTGTIGNDSIYIETMPFNVYWKSSFAQTIYYKDDIGISGGVVIGLDYFNNFVSANCVDKNVKIWLANTDSTALNAWLPLDNFTLVFDGTKSFPEGKNTISFDLGTNFVYTGNNLVIMTERLLDTEYFKKQDCFKTTKNTAHPKCSRTYNHDSQSFNWTQAGSSSFNYPNVVLRIATEGGSVSGVVTDASTNNPIEGAKVIDGSKGAVAYTNAQGQYSFGFVLTGEHNLTAEKFAYNNATASITVVADQNTEKNFQLEAINKVTVKGVVKPSDNPAGFLEGVEVTLKGYENYTATTNAQGAFEIANVYVGKTYALKLVKSGYTNFEQSVEVAATATGTVNLGNLTMLETANPPVKVIAEQIDNGQKAKVKWSKPGTLAPKVFQWDDGTAVGQLGVSNGTKNAVLGSIHKNVATLNSMSWFLTDEGGPHPDVKVFVFGLKANGTPNKEDLLFSQDNVPNTNAQWNIFEFPTPIEAPNGFFVALSADGFVALGMDDGVGEPYIFKPNTQFAVVDITTGDFAPIESLGEFQKNFLIRAEGYDHGEITTKDAPVYANNNGEVRSSASADKLVYIPSEKINTVYPNNIIVNNKQGDDEKALTGYKVFRLKKGEETTPNTWTSLTENTTDTVYTDNGWNALAAAVYKYAVKAIYTGGTLSNPAFSNDLPKAMEVKVTINLTLNGGDSPAGTVVKLTNNDGLPIHDYEMTAPATGKVIFENVWKGTYKISVKKDGYTPVEETNIVINEDLTKAITLLEITIAPTELTAEVLLGQGTNPNTSKVKLSWQHGNINAIIKLEAHDVWGDGSGYQILLDADATEFGNTIPATGPLTPNCNVANTLYKVFESTVPAAADPSCTSTNIVMNGVDQVEAPAGTYDYCVVNPTPGDRIWIAGGENSRKDNFVIEAKKTYHFKAAKQGTGDNVELIITDNKGTDSKDFKGFIITQNGTVITQTPVSEKEYTVDNLPFGKYYFAVKAKYGSGETDSVSVAVTINSISELASKVGLYPNPANTLLNVELPEGIDNFVVCNYLGQTINSYRVSGAGKYEVNVADYAKGSYLIKFVSKSGVVFGKQFIVTK